ncbi:MAG: hypothetical protein JXB25_09105 [Deltaproteobacteria bacterium]|nr:hypothetical protein [Deltaproteobacteria bacterium]
MTPGRIAGMTEFRDRGPIRRLWPWAAALLLVLPNPGLCSDGVWSSGLEWFQPRLGGQITARGSVSDPPRDSLFAPVGTERHHDAGFDARLKGEFTLAPTVDLELHYELVGLTGETWRDGRELGRLYPGLGDAVALGPRPISDRRRLFDLTKVIDEGDDGILYHRLDRCAVTWKDQGTLVRLGRQAVTWGHGFLFNPMDLLNPFAPTDIERDYKVGDDMAFFQHPFGAGGDLQLVLAPRRHPDSGKIAADQSSLGGKYHFAVGTLETDLMAARHYEDVILGIGNVGYLGRAAWRLDVTWTIPDADTGESDYLALVANLDTSWVWLDRNWYGLLEFYYNGLGDDDYGRSIREERIAERFERGELFTLGRFYLGATLQVELHPLLNFYLTAIANLEDPSGILQPRLLWDATESLRLTLGANLYWGGPETEYGGFEIGNTGLTQRPAPSVYAWLSWYF